MVNKKYIDVTCIKNRVEWKKDKKQMGCKGEAKEVMEVHKNVDQKRHV